MLQLYLLTCIQRDAYTCAHIHTHTCDTHIHAYKVYTADMYILRSHAYTMCAHTHAYHTYVYNTALMPGGLT